MCENRFPRWLQINFTSPSSTSLSRARIAPFTRGFTHLRSFTPASTLLAFASREELNSLGFSIHRKRQCYVFLLYENLIRSKEMVSMYIQDGRPFRPCPPFSRLEERKSGCWKQDSNNLVLQTPGARRREPGWNTRYWIQIPLFRGYFAVLRSEWNALRKFVSFPENYLGKDQKLYDVIIWLLRSRCK